MDGLNKRYTILTYTKSHSQSDYAYQPMPILFSYISFE